MLLLLALWTSLFSIAWETDISLLWPLSILLLLASLTLLFGIAWRRISRSRGSSISVLLATLTSLFSIVLKAHLSLLWLLSTPLLVATMTLLFRTALRVPWVPAVVTPALQLKL